MRIEFEPGSAMVPRAAAWNPTRPTTTPSLARPTTVVAPSRQMGLVWDRMTPAIGELPIASTRRVGFGPDDLGGRTRSGLLTAGHWSRHVMLGPARAETDTQGD